MNHNANCPTCDAPCTWNRSESDWENGAPVRTIYFHNCGACRKKFTHVEAHAAKEAA